MILGVGVVVVFVFVYSEQTVDAPSLSENARGDTQARDQEEAAGHRRWPPSG